MLTEYAITPQIFEWEHNSDRPEWLDLLRSFCARLFGEGRDGTVISNLYDGSWFKGGFITSYDFAKKHRHDVAVILSEIIKQCERRCVLRPEIQGTYPCTEAEWVDEAKDATPPICQIVASSSDFGVNNFFSLEEPFWTENRKTKYLVPNTQLQIREIARLIQFSSAIALVCPFFCRGLDCNTRAINPHEESIFPMEILKQKIASYNRITPLHRVDVHVEYNTQYNKVELAKGVANHIRIHISQNECHSVNVFIRDKITDRRILFGDSNNNDFKLRWAISATHFPIRTDDSRQNLDTKSDSDPQVLALLGEKDASKCRSRYYGDRSPDYST